jgi:hypothetical protein
VANSIAIGIAGGIGQDFVSPVVLSNPLKDVSQFFGVVLKGGIVGVDGYRYQGFSFG